jgi:hypothetical protein
VHRRELVERRESGVCVDSVGAERKIVDARGRSLDAARPFGVTGVLVLRRDERARDDDLHGADLWNQPAVLGPTIRRPVTVGSILTYRSPRRPRP